MQFFASALIRWSVETFTDKAFQIFVRNLRVGSLERAIKCEWKIMMSPALEDRSKVDQLSDSWGRNGASLPFCSNEAQVAQCICQDTERNVGAYIYLFNQDNSLWILQNPFTWCVSYVSVFYTSKKVFVFMHLLKLHREDWFGYKI